MRRHVALFSSLLLCCVLFRGLACAQTTIHVPGDQPTIQAGIDAAVNGDTVLVAPGSYFEHIDFKGKAITVTSSGGAAVTTIDGNNIFDVPVVNFGSHEGLTSILRGFTIRHASATFGAGISLLSASPTITDNVFDTNAEGSGGFGAGIGGNISSPDIERNLFVNNNCDGQFLSGVVSFVNTSSPKIINNIFVDNPCRAINMTLPVGSQPVVINNTIVRNRTGIRVATGVPTSQQIYENNIIVGNTEGLATQFGTPADNPTWSHNLVFGNTTNYVQIADQTGLNGNISADPLFVSSSDFHLLGNSPAIDAGDNSAPNLPAQDFDGNPRIVDGNFTGTPIVDMGAYEFQVYTMSAAQPASVTMVNGAVSLPISFQLGITGKVPITVMLDCSAGLPPNATCSFSPSASVTLHAGAPVTVTMYITTQTSTPPGSYSVTLTASAAGFFHSRTQTIGLTVNAGTGTTDLSVTATHTPDPVRVGGPLTVTFTIGNTGQDATGVTFNAFVDRPISVSASPSQGTCPTVAPVHCDLGTVANGANATVTVTVIPGFVRSVTATGIVSSDLSDSDPSNDIDSATAQVRLRPRARK